MANKAGAGNGARSLSFHFVRHGRAVPDLCRSAKPNACQGVEHHYA
jgi:hypothetical protein